jgi:hypothetical protein
MWKFIQSAQSTVMQIQDERGKHLLFTLLLVVFKALPYLFFFLILFWQFLDEDNRFCLSHHRTISLWKERGKDMKSTLKAVWCSQAEC